MTNAIEVTKREMCKLQKAMLNDPYVDGLGDRYYRLCDMKFGRYEAAVEAHLEQLRQQYEAMAVTARERFDSIRTLEAANELQAARLAKIADERNVLRNRAQALEHANSAAGDELRACQAKVRQFESAVMFDTMSRELHETRKDVKNADGYSERLRTELLELQRNQGGTSAQVSPEVVYGAEMDASTATIVGAVGVVQRVLADWNRDDLRAKKALRMIGSAINGDSAVLLALKSFEEQEVAPRLMTNEVNIKFAEPECSHSYQICNVCQDCGKVIFINQFIKV